jgi:hypothetical protein
MTDATQPLDRATFGPQGEACSTCGALLARDQRYCLECGARRAGLGALLAAPREPSRETAVERTTQTSTSAGPWSFDAGLLAGIGCLLLALFVGVLIGRGGGDGEATRATAPQVVTIGSPTPAPSGGAPVSFTSDWPAGKRGFTVQLQVLPKDGTDAAAVAAAEQAATAKGAPDVGALDSDAYGTLDAGGYVVYSGQFADRKAASAALGELRGDFPDAKVVEVAEKAAQAAKGGKDGGSKSAATGRAKAPSAAEQASGAQAIKDIEGSTGKDYSKRSAKLPKTLVTPGEPPPEDTSKPAGGGSDSVTFP